MSINRLTHKIHHPSQDYNEYVTWLLAIALNISSDFSQGGIVGVKLYNVGGHWEGIVE